MTKQETDLQSRINRILLAHGFQPDNEREETWTREGKDLVAVARYDSEWESIHVKVCRKGSDDVLFQSFIHFDVMTRQEFELAFRSFEL